MSENREEYNRGGFIAFMFTMAFVLAFFVYIVFINRGVDLGENLQDPKAAGAGAVAAVDVSKIAEPWVSNPDMVAHGKKVYSTNCSICHGAEGKGDGAGGAALIPKPRDLVQGPWKKGGGSIGLYTVLTEGLNAMPKFAHLSTTDRWAMVQFINSITNAKVTEDAAKVAAFAKTAK